ncbi:MAG: hypothetical protein IPJ19_14730 [Planctomycetes bacterium]|nr:hypothetical protein [Planctomycetota bacterium]
MRHQAITRLAAALVLTGFAACGGGDTGTLQPQTVSSCMLCHNGALQGNYTGTGIENPHPFGTDASALDCTTCHGGNPNGTDELTSHVPPPPAVGDRTFQDNNAKAYFNRLTLTGLDKFADYVVDGQTYTALDYLQFVNPGDLRIVTIGRGCGQCHTNHAEDVGSSLLATEAGFFSGATYHAGEPNLVAGSQGLYQDTAADIGFRAITDPNFSIPSADVGDVGSLVEATEWAVFNATGPDAVFNNNAYLANVLANGQNSDHTLDPNSPLAHLYQDQVIFTCGDCHLGSAGQNNRAGDFRTSGCSACHMRFGIDGKSQSSDPNVVKTEPANPDAIQAPEKVHVLTHRIVSVARAQQGGGVVQGIGDHACAGCHQGSNRTVMQYWGVRLDQNQDVRNHVQYPANPVSFQNTANNTELFDPVIANQTFNGRNANQYLDFEDYDGDGRDDTPEDVHYAAGMGCIDCHGSFDLHGGDTSTPGFTISSRMEQQVGITCEACHGTIEAYASTVAGTDYDNHAAQVAVDGKGNKLKHVTKDQNGNYWLKSRLTGALHYIPQTKDTVADSGRTHPTTGDPIYDPLASYAMGRCDNTATNGVGPKQTSGFTAGFSHTDRMDCASCHGSWTNTCMGCHLSGEYNTGNNFSNITGERIVFKQRTADFTYQSPLFFQLGVGPSGKITQFSANTKVFFRWQDKNGDLSQVFTFTDRNGGGNNPAVQYPALSHNAIMAHSIRGKVSATREGPRYCVACHLTTESIANYGTQYDTFRTAMSTGNFGSLDFTLLKNQLGKNTGNQNDSPFFAHMAAGLGTGLFLFDAAGRPINPLDNNANRKGTDGVAPSSYFDVNLTALDLDRIVDENGIAQGSNNHTWLDSAARAMGQALRDGCSDPELAGPLGLTLVRKLTDPATGIVLDSWVDANGAAQGNTSGFLNGP